MAAGSQVVRQGEPGSSLFVVVDGLLEVKVDAAGGEQVVARIEPGQFFGEMSLLTGEPRSATVTALSNATVYELTHQSLEPILRAKPRLAETLARVLAERKLRNEARLRSGDTGAADDHRRSLAQEMLHKMRGFFKLGH